MVQLMDPMGLWAILANIAFLMAALFSDVLLIRLSLCWAYFFLFLNGITGIPNIYDLVLAKTDEGQRLALDMVIWSVFIGSLHILATSRFVLDEGSVRLPDEAEPYWRFFWRRAGMPRLEFSSTFEYATVERFPPGTIICDNMHKKLCIIVSGLVEMETVRQGMPQSQTLRSGDIFDLSLGNIFGINIGFDWDDFRATTKTECVCLVWSVRDVNRMAAHGSPGLSSFWRNLLLHNIAGALNRQHPSFMDSVARDCHGELEDKAWLEGSPSRDFVLPLRSFERPSEPTARSILKWVRASLHPFPPRGMRHRAVPVTGILARNRILALLKAHYPMTGSAQAQHDLALASGQDVDDAEENWAHAAGLSASSRPAGQHNHASPTRIEVRSSAAAAASDSDPAPDEARARLNSSDRLLGSNV